MKLKANKGEIIDSETGKQIAVLLKSNCTNKLRDKLVFYAVFAFNEREKRSAEVK